MSKSKNEPVQVLFDPDLSADKYVVVDLITDAAKQAIATRKLLIQRDRETDAERKRLDDQSDGKVVKLKKRSKKRNPLGMTDHKRPSVTLPSRSCGLPPAVMLPIGARPIKKPSRADVHASTPLVADRMSLVQLREEISRLQAHRTRLRGEIRSRAKRNLPDHVIDRTMLQFAQTTGKLDYCLNLLIKAGAETATPVKPDATPMVPTYSDTAIGQALREAVKASDKPFTKTILPDGKASGLPRHTQVATGGKRGRGGTIKAIDLPYPKAGLLPK